MGGSFCTTLPKPVLLLLLLLSTTSSLAEAQRNVLVLIADDLRPSVGAFADSRPSALSDEQIHTPNIDALAADSVLFERSYSNFPLCGPSRASFLTGRRPDTIRVYDNWHDFRELSGNADLITLPEHFKNSGYRTFSVGKVFHPNDVMRDPQSWSVPELDGYDYYRDNQTDLYQAVPPEMEAEYTLVDTQAADMAIDILNDMAQEEDPFLLFVGFRKPHVPWAFPERFLEHYEDTVDLPRHPTPPVGMPSVAWHQFYWLGTYSDNAQYDGVGYMGFSFSDEDTLKYRQGYYAATTHVDDELGRVLAELQDLGMAEDTAVIFMGDHGYSLGEQGEWEKNTNFELGVRTPLMIKVPDVTDGGARIPNLVELSDLAPTLVSIAGLPEMPLCPEEDSADTNFCTEGSDLSLLISDPSQQWKEAVFSQHYRPSNETTGHHDDADDYLFYTHMGYTIRTDRYRYTEWPEFDYLGSYLPDWNSLAGVELYDYEEDPDETINLVEEPEYATVVEELRGRLRTGWRGELV